MPAENSAVDPIDPVGPLADDFMARHRRGENPDVADYVARYPELAARIEQLFPMLLAMEEAGADQSVGATAGPDGPGGEWAGPNRDRVGGYRLLREIGRGGMGIVYEAEQVALGRHVALKVLPLHAARDGSGLERFRLEARAAARLHHTNIVPVYEVGQDGDAYFYAMQFIPGQPLDQVLDELRKLRSAQGTVPRSRPADSSVAQSLIEGLPDLPQQAPASGSVPAPSATLKAEDRSARGAYHKSVARLGIQVAQALDYAHKEGVIHRDVKPSNLLLDADGRVWVTDFGLAKTDGTALTQTGDIVGTIRYMAPERFNGWSDPRSDIYALGLTLYEMLALRPAFDAPEQGQVMRQVLHSDPPALRKADPQVPRDLETIVAKAMDKEPSRRYQAAADLGADLQRFVEDRPILARRASLGERAWRWSRRNPALAAATALTFAALLIATVVSALFAVAQGRAADREKNLSAEQKAAKDKAEELAAELDRALTITKEHAARSAVHRAQSFTERGQVHEAMLWLAHALELAPPEADDVRRFARADFAALEAAAPVLRAMWETRHDGPAAVAAFSADGTTILTGSDSAEGALGEARLWEAATGKPLTDALPHDGALTQVAISPDGRALLTVCSPQQGQTQVQLWDATTGKSLTAPLPHPGTVTGAVCGLGGRTFFTAGSARPEEPAGAWFWEVADGTATPRALAHAGPVTALAVSPRGDAVLTAWHSLTSVEGGLRLWDARRGQPATSTAFAGVVTAATFAASGAAWVGTDVGTVWFWDPGVEAPQQWLFESRGAVRGLALAPAGDMALVISENLATGRSEARLWDLYRSQWLGLALPHDAEAVRAAFSSDGRRLLTWDTRRPIRVWDLDTDRRWTAVLPVPMPPADFGSRRTLCFRPDGSLLSLAVGQQSATATVWDADARSAASRTMDAGAVVHAAAVSPDGRITLLGGMREAHFWDNGTGKQVGSSIRYAQTLQRAAFSPDGSTVALATSDRLWLVDVASGAAAGPTFPAPGHLTDLRFASDGESLWLCTLASVRRLDVASGRDAAPGVVVRGRGFLAVVPAPDGRQLAALDRSGVALWDIKTGGRADFTVPRAPGPGSLGFSPDGTTLLAADPAGVGAQLWDLGLGKPVGLPLRCPPAFAGGWLRPDGRAMAVENATGVVWLAARPEPAGGNAVDVAGRAQALGGLALSPGGEVRSLSPETWHAPAGDEPPPMPWHLRRGLDRIEVGQWSAALWHLDRQLREQPDDWLALALRSRALVHLNRLEQAAADFDRSFEKGPAGMVFAWHLQAAQRAAPNDIAALAPAKPRRATVAAWIYDRLISRDARESVPLLLQRARGGAQAFPGQRVLEDYERAARLAPDDAAVLMEVARACLREKQPDRAADYFAKAAAAEPRDGNVWIDTARQLVRLERWDRAAEHFLHALNLLADNKTVGSDRSTLYRELARTPQVFDRASGLRPDDSMLWTGRARVRVEQGDWKGAADDFARAVELSAVDERSYELAAVLLILGDEKGYRQLVARMVEKIGDTRDPFLAYALARTCALAPDSGVAPARVVAWAERAVAEQPPTAWYLHTLGLALYRQGDYQGAVARLKESEKSDWVPVLNWLVLGMAEQRLGHQEAAKQYLAKATESLDRRPPAKPFTATLFSTDAEEIQIVRREAEALILGKL
jgi:serine/threonine protein kinase/WD40 repeat protein/Flp pilus assembly protein TadD